MTATGATRYSRRARSLYEAVSVNMGDMTRDLELLPATSAIASVKAAIGVASKGLPAIRAALHGARIGAGVAFGPAVVERLGVQVVAEAPVAAAAIGARSLMLVGKDGVALQMSGMGKVAASASEGAVRSVALLTKGAAFAGALRAVRQGAAIGLVVDGAFGAYEAAMAVGQGKLTRREGALLVGKRAARGAISGAGGVAFAGAASAVMAATGLAIGGAPIVVPFVAMAAAGVAISKGFDRIFGE